MPGAKDPVVLDLAQKERRVVVTADTGFGELAFRSGLPAQCGIVLIRLDWNDPEADNQMIATALASRTTGPESSPSWSEIGFASDRFRPRARSDVGDGVSLDTQWLNFASNALDAIGGGAQLLEIMATRLLDEDVRNEALAHLFTAFEGVIRWGGGFTAPAEVPDVSARWLAFIAAHRSELDARKRFPLEDPALTADLVPHGWKLGRAGKPDWPPGR